MNKRYFFTMIAILILAGLACNASDLGQESPPDEQAAEAPASDQPATEGQPATEDQPAAEGEPADQTATEGEPVEEASPSDQPANQPSSRPVGMREGLASLDSYYMVMHNINQGPTAMDHSEMKMETRFNAENDALYVRNESTESSAEYPEPYVDISEQFQVGLQSCSVSGSGDSMEAELTELTPLMQDMTNSTTNLFDITITVPDATLVGQETVNGIPSNHYTFRISGLGDYSGSEVTMADGEYWVAEDGQYLVKYSLILEIRTAPEGDAAAEVVRSEIRYDLMEVNQPQAIAIPPNCTAPPSS